MPTCILAILKPLDEAQHASKG